ncbi:MAG: hypothetical protein P8I31_02900 [Bacteroidia bacterium]|nr:hypothetical protein [Bacteroidia bacterium]
MKEGQILYHKLYSFFTTKGVELLIYLLIIVATFKGVVNDQGRIAGSLADWTKGQVLFVIFSYVLVVWVIISMLYPWKHKNLTDYTNAKIRKAPSYRKLLLLRALYFAVMMSFLYFSDDTDMPMELNTVFSLFLGILMCFVYFSRKKYILENMFSIKPIHYIAEYLDYINRKILDDEPHLEIGQSMLVSLRKIPRNEEEEEEVEIRNPNTPNSPALICKINNRVLADKLREGGCELKVKLFEIGDYGRVTLEMFLDCDEEIKAK